MTRGVRQPTPEQRRLASLADQLRRTVTVAYLERVAERAALDLETARRVLAAAVEQVDVDALDTCKRGHPRTVANTSLAKGYRLCRPCDDARRAALGRGRHR